MSTLIIIKKSKLLIITMDNIKLKQIIKQNCGLLYSTICMICVLAAHFLIKHLFIITIFFFNKKIFKIYQNRCH